MVTVSLRFSKRQKASLFFLTLTFLSFKYLSNVHIQKVTVSKEGNTILHHPDIASSLEWISPCVYEAVNFCVLPGVDSGILLFSKSGVIDRAPEEISGVTKSGILLCTEKLPGFLNYRLGKVEKEAGSFFELLSNRSAHIINSASGTMPSHLLYTFPSAYSETRGRNNYDVYFTTGGTRLKNHIQRGSLLDFLDTSEMAPSKSTNVQIQMTLEYSKSNSTSILGSVFPNFYIKDILPSGSIKCYRKGVIGKKVALSGETFLPPFVDFPQDRDQQIKILLRRTRLPFSLGKLENSVDQKIAQEYRQALLQKIGVNSSSASRKRPLTVLFALRKYNRKVLNIDKLIGITKKYAPVVEQVFMDDLSFVKQIQVGAAADILIGPEGSNLWITFWQKKFKAIVLLQNPESCIARCEWYTSLSDGKHSLYYESNPSGVFSRIAWWAGVHAFVLDTRKCNSKFSLRSKDDRAQALKLSSRIRETSYNVSESNFERVLRIALDKISR